MSVREMDLPSNSYRSKEQQEREHLKPVAKGRLIKPKESPMSRLVSEFIEEDGSTIGNYIVYDVLIPALKGIINDAIGGGLERLLYGAKKPPVKTSGYSYVPYSSYYSKPDINIKSIPSKEDRYSIKKKRIIGEVEFGSRETADKILCDMIDICNQYHSVSVADFYDLIDEPSESEFTDQNFGWRDLSAARIRRTRGGYSLELPPARPLDD